MGNRSAVGAIFGDIASTRFDVAVADPALKRLDYVETEHQNQRVLGIVQSVTRESRFSYDDALAGMPAGAGGRLAAKVHVIGFRDARGRVQVPRTPFAPGAPVRLADAVLVQNVLGLEGAGKGAFLGHVKGLDIPVNLHLNTLAQKHLSVLAKTGAGKSYTVGVILEEFLEAKVPMVILDPHGEYGSLRHPNVEDKELDAMLRYHVKPRSFQSQVKEYAIDATLNPDAQKLRLEGMNLEAREIVDILPTKLAGGQVGVLYQAVKEVADHLPAYTVQDVIDAVALNKSNAKWNVLNALEALQATGIFHVRGTPLKELVKPGQCTIINLKGVAPDVQEVVVTRLAHELWNGRKRNEVPPHILVVEEAHNFCPERGVGSAVSGGILRTVASEGRKFGMGLVIVSQRPAKVDKNVLSQCSTQVVMKVTNPNDLKAIVQSVEGLTADTADEIQRLPVGVALVAGGGLTQPVFVDVRPRKTRHGGASIDVLGASVAGLEPDPAGEGEEDVGLEGTAWEVPSDARDEAEAGDTDDTQRDDGDPGSKGDAGDEDETGREEPEEIPALVIDLPAPSAWMTEVREQVDHLPGSEEQRSTPARDPSNGMRPPEQPATATPEGAEGAEGPDDPLRRAIARARRHAVAAPAPPERRIAKRDLVGIHRVATRLGVAAGDDPVRTDVLLRNLALSQKKRPEHYLRMYRDIAGSACSVEEPACIRCPLNAECAHHARLQRERQKERGVIRRLWRR